MWQFTLRNDKPKQKRKLPEIAIFDTDGNPVDFGGGGGSVDLLHLTELGFGDETDSTITRDSAGNVIFKNDANAAYFLSRGGFYSVVGEYDPADPWSTPFLGFEPDWGLDSYASVEEAGLIRSAIGDDGYHSFEVNVRGVHSWGDGSSPVDAILRRTNPGELTVGDINQASGFQTRYGGVNTPSIYEYVDGTTASITLHSFDVDPDPWTVLNVLQGFLGQDRFNLYSDGSMHWGDGIAVPDVSLERNGYSGSLLLAGDDSYSELVIGNGTPDTVWDNSNIDAYVAAGSAVVGANGQEYATVLAEVDSYVARLDVNPSMFGARFELSDGTNHIYAFASGGIIITKPGDGIQLKSPDGTQTKTLRLSNAGALELV